MRWIETFEKYFIVNKNQEYFITVFGDTSLTDVKYYLSQQSDISDIEIGISPAKKECISFKIKDKDYLVVNRIMKDFDKLKYMVSCREKMW